MIDLTVRNADEALAALAQAIKYEGQEVKRRGRVAYELRGVTTVNIMHPRERLCVNPARALNPWVSLAEFPWLVAGRCDVAWLLPYLPRAADFSDDGRYWRAGYGPRLRRWGHMGDEPLDQLAGVVQLLANDTFSRQAVISLWDPAADLGARTKDMPCTNWLHFQCVEGSAGIELDLTVVMRSNDLMWGFSGINVVNFTLLQELVAAVLGLRLGVYRHVSTNMHVYREYFGKMEYIDRSFHRTRPVGARGMGHVHSLGEFTDECRRTLEALERWRAQPAMTPLYPWQWGVGPWLAQWAYLMSLHPYYDSGRWGTTWWMEALSHLTDDTWRLAVARAVAAKWPELYAVVELTAGQLLGPGATDYLSVVQATRPAPAAPTTEETQDAQA